MTQLLVLHFGAQCPWQPWMVEQGRQAAEQLGGKVQVMESSEDSLMFAKLPGKSESGRCARLPVSLWGFDRRVNDNLRNVIRGEAAP